MYNNLKNQTGRAGRKSFGFIQGVRQRLLGFCRCQKRCLLVAAVVLFVFALLNYFEPAIKGEQASLADLKQDGGDLIEEKAPVSAAEGLLGGPAINLNAAALSLVQPSGLDFTADDELENYDLAILEGSGVIGQIGPGSGDIFAGLRREVFTYLVEVGDNPFDIAVKFGLNTDAILLANNLREGDLIRPGDKLLILPLNGVRVKVAAKDSVASLAKKYSGKAEEIISFNNLSPDGQLQAGSFIIIPNGEMPAPPRPQVTLPKYASQTSPAGSWLITPTAGYNWGRLHGYNAVDISNPCGTPIYAAAAGKVILADGVGWNGGYGKHIKIQHPNGVVAVYAHASQLLVETGEQVGQGQLIALMGSTGRSSGCHLHFEVRGATNPLVKRK